jgi:hypothetical protein
MCAWLICLPFAIYFLLIGIFNFVYYHEWAQENIYKAIFYNIYCLIHYVTGCLLLWGWYKNKDK